MTESGDVELYEEAMNLLVPGETPLVGVVVHTDLPREAEPEMNKLMREVGDRIGSQLVEGETYVYAGDDDERFSAGQFHGRRLVDDEVVWECQQLHRDGTFDLVFYWERTDDNEAVASTLRELESDVVWITEDDYEKL